MSEQTNSTRTETAPTGANTGTPAQQALLDAFIQLGFRFKSADLEKGHIRGTRQKLPFYQEIEFFPPQQYRGLNQVELTFVADDREIERVTMRFFLFSCNVDRRRNRSDADSRIMTGEFGENSTAQPVKSIVT